MKNIILDLDGTISDSSEGIFATMRKVFSHYGINNLTDEILKNYIGPPLKETFGRYLPEDKTEEACDLHRYIYKEEGNIFKNKMYHGMDYFIKTLKQNGYRVFLGTTKGTDSSNKILENFGIHQYFNGVYGTEKEKNIITKTDVLNNLFKTEKISKNQSMLIGDTIYDAEGALNVGISVGIVLFGFGKKEQFKDKKIEFFVKNIDELIEKFQKAD